MSQPVSDRNLLFGVLALQMDFIKREQLITAMQAWVFDKSKPLGDILLAQKALAKDNHALLEALVQKHLAMHDNDAEKSLAAVSEATSIKKDLELIRDTDVQASLMRVAPGKAKPADPYATVAPSSLAPATGTRFRILRPHARGGLGEVFIAEDAELHREVALKEIQERQADNIESRSRFLIEAEITGGLEHPGIVPVYGLGTYADGRPYYAMRFIRGDSLKDAIDRFHKADAAGMDAGERALALRALLGRFVDVCDAIAYAHSRGVLHRDLKPGNIMLGKYGETLVVDWGLAKPMSGPQEKTEKIDGPGEGSLVPHSISSSSQTLMGSALGTPQYMSPEQAAGRLDQLGPPSDVYSLGATLFCLLTGQPPFIEKDVGVLLQKVQRGEFARPREIKASVPIPLEAICTKAMALNPNDRYQSPRGLADDIEHWLADEPVSAWREPLTVKARRWIGRHRTLVTGAAATVLVALVGLAITAVLLTAANERERQAKLRAEQNFKLARDAVDRYFTFVSTDVLLNEPGMQPLQKKLLGSAQEFYAKFVKERSDDPNLQGELARATFRLAQITGEIDSKLKAIELHEQAVNQFEKLTAAQNNADYQSDLAACHYQLGRLYRVTDQLAKSESNFKEALKLWEQLAKEQPNENRFLAGLARTQLGIGACYQDMRRTADAESYYQQTTDNLDKLRRADPQAAEYQRDWAVTQQNLGRIYRGLGEKEDQAKKAFANARAVQQKLVDAAPNVSLFQIDLARTDLNLGDYAAAAKLSQAVVERHPALTAPHMTLAVAFTTLSEVYRKAGDFVKAEEACEQALKIQRALAANYPDISSYQGELGRGLFLMGNAYLFVGQKEDKAKGAFEEATTILDKLARDFPQVPHHQSALARVHQVLGLTHASKAQGDKAIAEYGKALDVWKKLVSDYPKELEFKNGLRDTLRHRAESLTELRRYPDAQTDWDQALELSPPKERSRILFVKNYALARSGNHTEATKNASAMLETTDGNELFWLAKVYALSAVAAAGDAKASKELADQYAAEALKLLGSANEHGYFRVPANLQRLLADPDFKSLRERPEFKKWSSELKAK
jgi:eukaryotic-like serine/threonine-protein kinase